MNKIRWLEFREENKTWSPNLVEIGQKALADLDILPDTVLSGDDLNRVFAKMSEILIVGEAVGAI